MGRSGKNQKLSRLSLSRGNRALSLDINSLVGFEDVRQSLLTNQDLIRDRVYDDQFLGWLEQFDSDDEIKKEDAYFRALEMFLYLGFETEPSTLEILKHQLGIKKDLSGADLAFLYRAMTHIQALEKDNSPRYRRLKNILSQNGIDLSHILDYDIKPVDANTLGIILSSLRRSENSADAQLVESILANNSDFLKTRSSIEGEVADIPFAVLDDGQVISDTAGITFDLHIGDKVAPIAFVNAEILGNNYQFEEYMPHQDTVLKVAVHEMIHANAISLTGEGVYRISDWSEDEAETLKEGLTESLAWLNTSDLGEFQSNVPIPTYIHFVVNTFKVLEQTGIEKSKYREVLSDLNGMKAEEIVEKLSELTNSGKNEFKNSWFGEMGSEFEVTESDLGLLASVAQAQNLREGVS